MEDNQLLTAVELASKLKLKPETVRQWTRKKMIPCIRVTNKVIRYEFSAVVEALKSQSEGVTA